MTETTADPASTDATFGIPPDVYHRRRAILAVLCLSLVTIVVAVSSLNVAIPRLQEALAASPTQLQWIVDSYALVFAGFLLPAGALGDRFGRKGALQIGLVIFGVCALVASQATSPTMLIAARAVMGLGAALVMPATLSIIQNSFPAHERSKAVATWAGLAGAGAAIGPLTAGVLLEHFWWGSIFFINIPLVLLLLGLSVVIVPTLKDPHGHALDPIGALLSVVGLVSLVFAIIEGPEWGWGEPSVIGIFAAAAVFLVAFVVWELRAKLPTLDPRLFKLPGFGMGSLSITMIFLVMFGMFFLVTQYLQYVKGYSPLGAGVRTLPSAVMMVLISPRSPVLTARLGVRTMLRIGFVLIVGGFVQLGFLGVDSPYWHFALAIVFTGAGMALVMPPSTSAIISSLPLSKAGVGSAVNDVTREVGGAIGIAVLGSILNSFYASKLDLDVVSSQIPAAGQGQFGQVRPVIEEGIGPAMAVARKVGTQPFPGAAEISAGIESASREAFTSSMSIAFFVAAAIAAVAGAVVTSYIPDRPAMGPAHAVAEESGVVGVA